MKPQSAAGRFVPNVHDWCLFKYQKANMDLLPVAAKIRAGNLLPGIVATEGAGKPSFDMQSTYTFYHFPGTNMPDKTQTLLAERKSRSRTNSLPFTTSKLKLNSTGRHVRRKSN